MMRKITAAMFLAAIISISCSSQTPQANTEKATLQQDYNVKPVPFNMVNVSDNFWQQRLETNQKVTIPHTFQQCEETGRLNNFRIAAGLMEGKRVGAHFDDSDVHKIMEGAAYALQVSPDQKLRDYLENLIDIWGKAQWENGYLYTYYSIPEKRPQRIWENIGSNHELYTAGHMYEAAAAHYLATGERQFLDIAIKNADLVCSVFGPGKRTDPPGHQEIEIALCKLYRVTGDKKYLDQAKFFLDQRGRLGNRGPDGKGGLYGTYSQDHIPVVEQTEAVGHSVRAAYLYTGMADVAALTGDKSYVKAIDTIWNNVITKKLYITGGIGAAGGHEGFGGNYELPNLTAYCETCASIANALWNERMFLMHDDAKYIDVLERIIYNGALSGVSLSGDRFFYPNPLESTGHHSRSPWFGCACCPSNVARFIPSIPGYAYAYKGNDVYVNLFIGGSATIKTDDNTVKVTQKTNYPWDGKIDITIEPKQEKEFTVFVRIPGWARNEVVPSDLYHFIDKNSEKPSLTVNGKAVYVEPEKGLCKISRKWKAGDKIALELPMPVRRIISNENIVTNEGKVALQRGPIVYCLEGKDNDGKVTNLVIPDNAKLSTAFRKDMLNGVEVITGKAQLAARDDAGNPVAKGEKDFVAIPYYAWAHRGGSEMTVWPARLPSGARPEPMATLTYKSKTTASYVHVSLDAIKDQIIPKSSSDTSTLQLDFWPQKGSTEWLQFEWDNKQKLSSVQIYWFDDTGGGECRVPKAWKVLYRDDAGNWVPVKNNTPYYVEKDKFNDVRFDAIETNALKIEIELQKDWSGGIFEIVIE